MACPSMLCPALQSTSGGLGLSSRSRSARSLCSGTPGGGGAPHPEATIDKGMTTRAAARNAIQINTYRLFCRYTILDRPESWPDLVGTSPKARGRSLPVEALCAPGWLCRSRGCHLETGQCSLELGERVDDAAIAQEMEGVCARSVAIEAGLGRSE